MISTKENVENFVRVGQNKASLSVFRMIVLGILAGMFIALAGVGSTVAAFSVRVPSVAKLISACIFPAGLAMVVVAGSELFTGNCLMTISVLDKKVKLRYMFKNWLFVYLGNLIGAVAVALLVTVSGVFGMFEGFSAAVINTAATKASMPFLTAFIKGILCNFLVCIAVFMAGDADTAGGKIAAVFFPIMLFVVCGFEHSVANMYYIPAGIFSAIKYNVTNSNLTVFNMFINNLLPVTLGNIVGGAGLVALPYFISYKTVDKK